MPELLDRIREEIDTRMGDLRPHVDEYGRLVAAQRALGDAPAGPPPGTPVQRKSAKAPPARAPRARAPRGANRAAALRAVEQRPGATAAELAAVSGVERNTLNGVLARMVKAGELRTRALPTGRTGYALGQEAAASKAGVAPGPAG